VVDEVVVVIMVMVERLTSRGTGEVYELYRTRSNEEGWLANLLHKPLELNQSGISDQRRGRGKNARRGEGKLAHRD
jgi:hypothetical protein